MVDNDNQWLIYCLMVWNHGILNDFPETVGNVISSQLIHIFQWGRYTTNQFYNQTQSEVFRQVENMLQRYVICSRTMIKPYFTDTHLQSSKCAALEGYEPFAVWWRFVEAMGQQVLYLFHLYQSYHDKPWCPSHAILSPEVEKSLLTISWRRAGFDTGKGLMSRPAGGIVHWGGPPPDTLVLVPVFDSEAAQI